MLQFGAAEAAPFQSASKQSAPASRTSATPD
jgi:hypothetical protein